MDNLIVSFQGDAADEDRLPAYPASQSLYGISRSLLIVANYLVEGRVRRRDFDSAQYGFEINFVAQRPGSFEFLYEIITDPLTRSVATKVAGDLTMDLIRSILRRAVGEKADAKIETLEQQEVLNPGDLSALVDAIDPAMKAAHAAVNHGARQVIIISGDNNVVQLNAETKEYVYSSIRDETPRAKLFSVASYNANSSSGRAFDYDLGKTVPFDISAAADRETISAVLQSMSSYAMRKLGDDLRSAVAFTYTATLTSDNRIKKMHVLKARAELSLL